MKKWMILTVLVMVAVAGFSVTKAADVTAVTVNEQEGEVSVQVGKTEFVSDLSFANLKAVRVWRAPDFLLYDLTSAGVDTRYNYDAKKPEIARAEAAKLWAKALKEFDSLKGKIRVIVILKREIVTTK